MNTDDFLNKDFNKEQYVIDQGAYQLHMLRLNIEQKYYLINLMANQLRIKSKLDNKEMDDEEVTSKVNEKLKSLEEIIDREYNDRLAFILK